MNRSARLLDSEDELYAAAVTALARRAHSVYEMRQYVERRAGNPALVPLVMARLKDRSLLDDAKYARLFARDRAANRRQGSFRIARELRARGVPDRHIQSALAELQSESDESENVRRRIQSWLRRHGLAGNTALDRKRTDSLYHSLLRAGFSADRIRDEIRRLGRSSDDLPESKNGE